jgi:hypothetical protein
VSEETPEQTVRMMEIRKARAVSDDAERAWEKWVPQGNFYPTQRDAFLAGFAARDAEIAGLRERPFCIACAHYFPNLALHLDDAHGGPHIGLCKECRDLAEPNRGPCSLQRGCICRRDVVPAPGAKGGE